ncbi:hypothetical protein [Caulobacter segnis]|uniref:hypothetical protein n=1 Tax=Caulobacter segnis TaxID=88688 RepID=UPI001CBE6C35|nr:hypothetical protein [Caulobacter segnis]UAL10195.1 hypothetical protein K8940_20895 [Caulobacter segnis]
MGRRLMCGSAPTTRLTPTAIREQLVRLQRSAAFAGSTRLTQFLNFIVDETLERAGLSLKEAVIGNALYGRNVPYDPRIDSTVRVEARRLRRKLTQYFSDEGRQDPIRVDLPIGTYVPTFAINVDGLSERMVEAPKPCAGTATEPCLLAIMPFIALTPSTHGFGFVDGVTDELIFVAERIEGLRVAPRLAVYQYRRECYTLSRLAQDLGCATILSGTIRGVGGQVRVTLELSDERGFVLWSSRLEISEKDEGLLQDEIVIRTFERLRAETPLGAAEGWSRLDPMMDGLAPSRAQTVEARA